MTVPDDREIPIVVSSLQSYYEAIYCARERCVFRPWFRGHRDGRWPLLPKPFRPPLVQETWRATQVQEHAIAIAFRARAAIRREVGLQDDDFFGWLSLMRHYQAPCRLLDWSQSPLVALYFALCGQPKNSESAVWVVDPYLYNAHVWKSPNLRFPVAWDNHVAADQARQAFEIAEGEHGPLAVVPKENSLRMMVQCSMFTIHGSTQPLADYADQPGILFKVTIDNQARTQLRDQLETLGINEQQLFPGLEQLASGVEEQFKTVGFAADIPD